MALTELQQKYIPQDNSFYRSYYHYIFFVLMLLIVVVMGVVSVILYQMIHRPLPEFKAVQPDHQVMLLVPYQEPNRLSDTLIRWSSKAATTAYTFSFDRYKDQVAAARPYFTEAGWNDYLASVRGLLETVVKNQLFVNGVVAGVPVISNQGPMPGKDYVWRIQIPFLVTYQSANTTTGQNFYVVLTVVRVPPSVSPQGIGIDQFVMISRGSLS